MIRFKVQSSKFIVKELPLCILSAVLLALSLSSFNLWIFAWLGFVPLFFALQDKTGPRAFLLSYFTGTIFWLGNIYWLVHVTFAGTVVLSLYLALYFGIFGYLISFFPIRYTLYAIPSIWVILEYLRAHLLTGFPWTLLGHSQYRNLPVIQIADITGAWGVSFLVMLANVVIYSVSRRAYCVLRKKQIMPFRGYLLPSFLLFLSLSYGFYQLRYPLSAIRYPLKISVIQGNIPQELKWAPLARGHIVDKYIQLTKKAAQDGPDLIVWPEAALPVVLEEAPALFERITHACEELNLPLLLGAVTSSDEFYYNSALLLSSQGEAPVKYNKLHLVPFGEYIPLREVLPFLETVASIGEVSPGKDYTIFELAGYPVNQLASLNTQTDKQVNRQTKFAVLICFEDLFPELARHFAKKGAQFLINITNDAWYKETSAPYQHLQASVFRAVENRLHLVRAANTGVSGFIAPSGEITSLVRDATNRSIFIDGYKNQEIAIIERQPTFFTKYGDVFIIACLLFLLYGIIRVLKKPATMNYEP